MTDMAAQAVDMKPAKQARSGVGFFSAHSRGWALGLLIVAAFAFGGGSRADITSLIVLRPLSFVLLAYAVMAISWREWKRLGLLGWVVLGAAALAALQLVPLPPVIWTGLPGRELPAEIAAMLGLPDVWRPLSLAPDRTLNALFSLGVPLATLALILGQPSAVRRKAVWLILAMGGLCGLLGLAQVMGPPGGPLYLYRITNDGLAVGLFSNRNHHAIFLASLLPLLGYAALQAWGETRSAARSLKLCAAIGGMAFAVPMVLVTGSRAGTVLALVMSLMLAVIVWRFMDIRPADGRSGAKWNKLAAPMLLSGVAMLAGITHLASRSLSIDRIMGGQPDAGLRADTLPHLWAMVQAYFPVGAGLGGFRQAWEVIEPRELLRPQYLNQAHNDLLQWVIEGGAAALALLLLGMVWLVQSGRGAWRQFRERAAGGAPLPLALFSWLSLVTLLAGSVFDYPLRTPSLLAAAALLAALAQLSLTSWREDASSRSTN